MYASRLSSRPTSMEASLMTFQQASTQPAETGSTKSCGEPLPYGLKILADGVDPIVEYVTFAQNRRNYSWFNCSIVAIHGLNGLREATWTVNGVNWLRDLLPLNIPNARIYTWGYDANTHSTSHISAQYLYDHARTLISYLCLKRRMTKVLALYLH